MKIMGQTRVAFVSLCVLGAGAVFAPGAHAGDGRTFPMWVPFSPTVNPPNEDRQILGKILFWDEQLSSDNTMSCGTCHIPSHAGNDPRVARSPGYDGIFMNEDDIGGSPGVILQDENGEYLRSVLFDLLPQVTPRRAMPNFIAPYSANLFWDGRAEGIFTDPVTGAEMSIQGVAATEIQAMMPLMNDIEMAHQNRDWHELFEKLEGATPLALASDIPQDMLDAIGDYPSYPELFEQAFGTPEISASRIAMAIGNYQRTLVPDQTPWDLWNAGDENAMTPDQHEGYFRFRETRCSDCHTAPFFSSLDFAVDGVRPPHEDMGRAGVTGANPERGAFKMGTLRNAGIRDRFMHTGSLETMDDVFDFYAYRNGHQPFSDNLDFRLRTPIDLDPADEALIKTFINEALTDPRIANEEYPFDRPKLYSENAEPNPLIVPGGNAGSGGFEAKIIAVTPPNIGNADFKVGLDYALGGAQAWVAVSSSEPTDGVIPADTLLGPITLNGMSVGDGYGTMFYSIDDVSMEGETFYMQWVIADPNAPGGFARSDIARVTPFCTMIASCAPECVADFDGNGSLDFFDVSLFIDAYNTQDAPADLDGNGTFDFFDVSVYVNAFAAGCP
ncbi:MAG: cytochrome c peroxidase [Phycisphaerales bacterium]